ncbi:unnamed protein product [Victoria cruziana]
MGRAPCEKQGLKKGPWTPDQEDKILVEYIKKNGHGSWRTLPKLVGRLEATAIRQAGGRSMQWSMMAGG